MKTNIRITIIQSQDSPFTEIEFSADHQNEIVVRGTIEVNDRFAISEFIKNIFSQSKSTDPNIN